MANLKDLGESRGTLINFDPRKIAIEPGFNSRDLTTPEARAHIDWLKESIKGAGFLPSHPLEIRTRGDDVLLTSGHCRLTAVMELIAEGVDIASVPAVPERRGTNDVDRFLAQNLDNSGLRLTRLEEARNIKRAIDLGSSIADVAKKLGRSATHVSQALDLMAAPQAVHNMIRDGEVTATFAAKTLRNAKDTPEAGVAVLRKAVDTAKAEGRTKASAKHVAPPAEPEDRPVPVKMKRGMVVATFGRMDVALSPERAVEVARDILAVARGGVRPIDEYHEDMGPVLWWRFPVAEAPWVGSMIDDDWRDGIYTHFEPIDVPKAPKATRKAKAAEPAAPPDLNISPPAGPASEPERDMVAEAQAEMAERVETRDEGDAFRERMAEVMAEPAPQADEPPAFGEAAE